MGKILLIEDDIVQVALIKNLLEPRGHQIIAVRSGAEGIKLAAREKPQLILMDMIIPGMHGLEATIKLKEDPKTREVPIIALTFMSSPKFVQECYRAGVAGYIKKPFDPKIVLESVEGIVGGPEKRTGRILIVTRASRLATMLEMRLLRLGYEVTTLKISDVSRERFENERAAAVFVDVSLPGPEVAAAFAALRAASGSRDVPTVAFADGMSREAIGLAAIRNGARFQMADATELPTLLRNVFPPAGE